MCGKLLIRMETSASGTVLRIWSWQILGSIFRYWDLSFPDICAGYGYLALHNDLCSNHWAWMLQLLCSLLSRKYWVLQANFYPRLLALTPPVLSVEEEAMMSKGGMHYRRERITRCCSFYVISGMPSLPLLSSCSPQATLRCDLVKQGKQIQRCYTAFEGNYFSTGAWKRLKSRCPAWETRKKMRTGMSSQFFEVLFPHRFTCFPVSHFLSSF